MSSILEGDCLDRLRDLPDDSVDVVITDPPYGYSFMGKDWDKAVPSVEIWAECLRVLKPGAFACVMSAPRSDVQQAMTERLIRAGFRLDFTPIYWTYASGFPKAGNVGKLVDKRAGVEREVVGRSPHSANRQSNHATSRAGDFNDETERLLTAPSSPEAKALDGSYAGFQPKPAVEVVIIAMKPLSEKTYVDQALKNGKGITWLDDGRIPTGENLNGGTYSGDSRQVEDALWQTTNRTDGQGTGFKKGIGSFKQPSGRFPANLLVSDDVLNDGVIRTSGGGDKTNKDIRGEGIGGVYGTYKPNPNGKIHSIDSGSYSRYFDLDSWARERLPAEQAMTFPFAIFPKASKSEKNRGLEGFEKQEPNYTKTYRPTAKDSGDKGQNTPYAGTNRGGQMKNGHPTVKPLRLMSYLITLFSREDDTVLDPFVGSGTTVVAAEQLGRKGIGIEREAVYAEIARARLAHIKPLPEEPESVPPVTMEEVLYDKASKNTEQLRLL